MKRLSIASIIVFAIISTIMNPAFAEEKSDWSVSGGMSIWDKYLGSGGGVLDNHISLQPDIAISHSSGFFLAGWASINLEDGDWNEIDYILGYGKEIFGLNVTADVAFWQYHGGENQLVPQLELAYATTTKFSELTTFVKGELIFETNSEGMSGICTYAGFRYNFHLSENLNLCQTHQIVVSRNSDHNWWEVYALDLGLKYKLTEKISTGPVFMYRVPINLPTGDSRKNETAFGWSLCFVF